MADEDPEEIRKWLGDTLARLGGASENAILEWEESFDFVDSMVTEYEQIAATPVDKRRLLAWPWETWNKLIDPLDDGMLAVATAPDGMGKTIYGESIAEHWARNRNKIVFVHYELNRKLMMLRRTARHTSVEPRAIKSGRLTPIEKERINKARSTLLAWDGYITYLHTPGWTMERTVAELTRLHAEGQCDAVVLDYLEKASASARQLRMFGTNHFQREADNVEQLKNFAETTGSPVLMIAQMSKDGKGRDFDKMDRTGMRGAGEKSEKANLVVMLNRDREEGGYSNMVHVLVDKNTMGATGTFNQWMQPEYYRVGDIKDAAPSASAK
jgi:replicative DNA helicase